MKIFLGCLLIYVTFSSFVGVAIGHFDNGRYLGAFKYAFIATALTVVFFALLALGVTIILK